MAFRKYEGQIREGMTVRSSDGHRLGKVIAVEALSFHVEKGLFFPKDYVASFDDIQSIEGEEIVLARGQEALRTAEQAAADTARDTQAAQATTAPGTTSAATTAAYAQPSAQAVDTTPSYDTLPRGGTARVSGNEEARMTLAEEQLDVTKRERDAGAVRLRKEVVEETKTIEVPVRREEVRVERVARTGEAPADASALFEEEEIAIPLREEEIEVHKRPVVTGEVRLAKETHQEERRVAETVRREEAHVESEGNVRGAPGRDDDPNRRY
jgi:uncharacterized protein (TIGR02271 family)